MKEIHEDDYKFVPISCVAQLQTALQQPCPDMGNAMMENETDRAPKAKIRLTDGAYE